MMYQKKTKCLLLDQPTGEANTTGTLISKIDEVAINAKTANLKAIGILNNPPSYTNKQTIPFDPSTFHYNKMCPGGILYYGIHRFYII